MSAALADPETEAPAEASWRDPDIETLRLSKKITSRLRGSKIESIGALVDALDNSETFGLEPREIAAIWHALKTNSDTPHILIDGPESDDEPETADVPMAEAPVPEIAKAETEVTVGETIPASEETPVPAAEGAEPPKDPPVATVAPEEPDEESRNRAAREALIRFRQSEQLRVYDRETVQLVEEEEQHVSRLEGEYEDKKEAAAEAKKEFEKAEAALRKLIRDRREDRGQPNLLDKPIDDDIPAAQAPAPAPTGQPSGDYGELWQKFPMEFSRWERWGLTAKDIEKLNGGETKNNGVCPILLFGDVSRFCQPNPANPSYTRSLKDFKGFGDKGAQRCADAELEFWKWWNASGAAEFAAEQGVKPNADSQEPAPGIGSEDPQPVVEAADGQPVEPAPAGPAEADDTRPLSDAAEPQHPDVAPPAPKKRVRKKKQPA